jgi:hypothetical protein
MNAIVIAWRGTEPFNTWDWSTDIDFSWARFQNGMAVHLGFLEALGLCHRDNVDSFIKMDNNAQKKHNKHTVHQDLFVLPPPPKKKKKSPHRYLCHELCACTLYSGQHHD